MPETFQTVGIVTRLQNYKETSLLSTWLTDRHGILSLLLRGARRPKQKTFDPIDLLSRAEITFQRSRRSDLHTAREIRCLDAQREVATAYPKLLTATYGFEVIHQLVEPDTPVNELYQLYEKLTGYLKGHPPTTILLDRYERRVLETLGLPHHGLSLEQARQRHYLREPKSWKALAPYLEPLRISLPSSS